MNVTYSVSQNQTEFLDKVFVVGDFPIPKINIMLQDFLQKVVQGFINFARNV